jgi:hypothetical protein
MSFFHEPPLISRDDFRKKLLDPVSYDLGHNFLRCITHRDGPRSRKRERITIFGNKCKKGRVSGTSQLCNVLVFGFPCFAVGGDLWGLCQPDQRVKWRLTMSSEGLRELYEAQPSPFTIFHHQDHFCT